MPKLVPKAGDYVVLYDCYFAQTPNMSCDVRSIKDGIITLYHFTGKQLLSLPLNVLHLVWRNADKKWVACPKDQVSRSTVDLLDNEGGDSSCQKNIQLGLI